VALLPQQPAVRLAKVGDRVTISAVAAADRPVPAWAVSTFVRSGFRDEEPCVEAALDRSSVVPGQTAYLTLTRRTPDPKRLCIVDLRSTLGHDTHVWPMAVVLR
jgi:hypothetical protein